MLAAAGQPETVWRVRGLKSDQRVRVILARARESGATGWWLLEKGLAIRACLAAKHIDWREREYIFANLARPVHRRGAGLKVTRADELLPPKYPRCEGRLRSHLGKMLDDALSTVSDQLVPQIVAMAASESTRKRGTEAERRASTGNPKIRHISVRSPLLVSLGGPLVGGCRKVAQVTGSEPTEGEGGNEERASPDRGATRAAPKGNDDDGIALPHSKSPILFFDPWLTSRSPAMQAITAEALLLLSEPAPASPSPPSPPTPTERPEDTARDLDAMIRRHGRVMGQRLATLRQQMRAEAARKAPPPPAPKRRDRKPTTKAAKDREMIGSSIIANFARLCLAEPEGARLAVPMAHAKLTRYDRPGFGQLPAILKGLTDRA